MDSGCHKLSENIWFMWSKRSYSGDKVGCESCTRTMDDGMELELKVENVEKEKVNKKA